MSESLTTNLPPRKQASPLVYFLGFVFCLFIGILIFAYMVTKRTHPIYVDEHGNPVNAESTDHNSNGGSGSK